MASPEVLYLDNHLLALLKPAGLLTQPTEKEAHSLEEWAKAFIKEKFSKPGAVFLHAVHRLDKPVSGVVLFARTSKALSRLNAASRARTFQKEYMALVEGIVEEDEGVLEHYLVHDEFYAQVTNSEAPKAKKCLLYFNVLKRNASTTFVKIKLETGRYHQIRAQWSAAGHPIVGDLKYGASENLPHILLHHHLLAFSHPVSGKIIHCEVLPHWFLQDSMQ